MKKILFVDQDHQFLMTLKSYFEDQYQILLAQNQKAARSIIVTANPDAIVIKLSPFEESHALRDHTKAGIIFIVDSENSDIEKKVFALGADYYVVQPIQLDRLDWKLKALLRKNDQDLSVVPTLEVGKIRIDLTNRLVFSGKTIRTVTPLQFDLLVAFAMHPDRLLSRSWLKHEIWKDEHLSNRTIDAHVSKLRKQLPEIGDMLLTVYGEGYRLCVKAVAA